MRIQKCSKCSGLALILSLPAMASLGGCPNPDAVEVRSYYGSGIKMDGIGSTWDWLPDEHDSPAEDKTKNSNVGEFIRDAIEGHLSAAGFARTTTSAPDFYLNYFINIKTETYTGGSPHGVEYEKGSLVIDVLDPQTRQLIWRGVAQAKLDDSMDPQARKTRINLALKEIVAKFPSRA